MNFSVMIALKVLVTTLGVSFGSLHSMAEQSNLDVAGFGITAKYIPSRLD